MISLNEELYNEFYVQELEKRLETDPFLVNGFMDSLPMGDSIEPASCFCNPICELTCVVY